MSSNGDFVSSHVATELCLSTREDKKNMSKVLSRMCDDGVIERDRRVRGKFRIVNRDLDLVDITDLQVQDVDIKYPLHLEQWSRTMKKNIMFLSIW